MRFFATHVLCWSLLGLAVACESTTSGDPKKSETTPPDTTDGGACGTTGSGTLTVTVTGLPTGVGAKVTVTGSSGSQEVTASGNVTLSSGEYSITAATVIVPDPTVRAVYTSTTTISNLCVDGSKAATAEVVYTLLPTSNKLWATNSNGDAELLGFSSSLLQATGTPVATVTGNVEIPAGVAFDKKGGLWALIGAAGAKALAHYPAEVLATSGAKTADITITGDALNGGVPAATGLAFDKAGNLWVSNMVGNTILRYDAEWLTASGSPAPSVSITNVDAPSALAFDGAGNLWAADGSNQVVEYASTRLAASTADPADVVLKAASPEPVIVEYQTPVALAFSPTNDLWVNYNGGALVRFPAADRAATATLTPTVQLKLTVDALAETLAFDESGGLWFAYSQGKIARLSSGQLTASADVTPEIVLTSPSVAFGSSVAFFPSPANVPLFSSLP